MQLILKNGSVFTDGETVEKDILIDGGVIAEEGTPKQVFENPQNPRTKEFLSQVL